MAAAPHTASRRGFLSQLAALPLIGGGVTLIGQPTAVAEPVTDKLIDAYRTWLFFERMRLDCETRPVDDDIERVVPQLSSIGRDAVRKMCGAMSGFGHQGAFALHFGTGENSPSLPPSTRAALVLSITVGAPGDWQGVSGASPPR